jgi:hypothetical protein
MMECRMDGRVIRLPHRGLIPHIIAHAALHAPNVAPVDLEGHGLDGFTFEGAQLADHVVEEMLAGLAPRPPPGSGHGKPGVRQEIRRHHAE